MSRDTRSSDFRKHERAPEGAEQEMPGGGRPEEAAEVDLAAVEEQSDASAEIERLRNELRTTQDQLLRHAADFQNYRRRADEELGRSVQLGRVHVVERMLDVLDDLRRSLEASEQAAEREASSEAFKTLHQGVSMVYRKLSDELARLGVEPLEVVGKPFHEDEHEALMQQPAPEGTPSCTVLAEVQKGYKMGDRVLRHARVIVAA
jgi:molecular chaperone GrpE